MRIVIQRCKEASVSIGGVVKGAIGPGMMILLGIEDADGEEDIDWLCRKVVALRIFDDADGVMNLPITLMASTKKGNRPSYIHASKPEVAIPIYEKFVARLEQELGKPVATGQFGANMQVSLVNDGPVTIIIDSKNRV